jgi:hypothetical protein
MNVQYNLANLKKCLTGVLNCFEKEDGSVTNLESLITVIKTFQELLTDIAKMQSIPALGMIFDHYSADIYEESGKLNFFSLMGKICHHIHYISDHQIDELVPCPVESSKIKEHFMLSNSRLNYQISNQILLVQIYFHRSLRKLMTFLANPHFVSKLNGGAQCSFCDPENPYSIYEHQLLSLIQIFRKLMTDLADVDIILSEECKDFVTATENLATQVLERECVKNMSKNLYIENRPQYRQQYSEWVVTQ